MGMMAPMIPSLNDHELEGIMEAVLEWGCSHGSYVLLRLPHEIKELFREWLHREVPDRASRVISLVQSMRGGQDYRAEFGSRMRGEGVFADLLLHRFKLAVKRLGFNQERVELRTDLFDPPVPKGGQMRLF
jgi:DNA repair photolyase